MKPLILTSPHSGERVPIETPWLSELPEEVLMCDVDRFVDKLYKPVIDKIKLKSVVAEWHRYAADLNRLANDIDPTCVEGAKDAGGQFPVGMGVHWSSTTQGAPLMPKPIPYELHELIIAKYHRPFHDSVKMLYAQLFAAGAQKVFHLDCHSMPSMGTKKHKDPGQVRPQIVVSDFIGKSCEASFKDLVIEAYKYAGFEVAYNWPYIGGRMTQTYGQPSKGQNAIQVEMSRALYMNEVTKQLDPKKAKKVSQKLILAVEHIVESL